MLKYDAPMCKIYCDHNVDYMKTLPDNYIDLTVTSPPYDDMRSYNGYTFDFEGLAKELYRTTKEGGVVVWIMADATIKGNETGTSFKQALYFKEIGFNLHDTMIWEKSPRGAVGSPLSYWQNFEYMFVFTKGKIKTFNPIEDRKNESAGKEVTFGGGVGKDGLHTTYRTVITKEFARRNNIWKITQASHPVHKAVFPEQLAGDHILSWSNEGDLVFEPFLGSGTTGKMALQYNRNFIGVDCSEEYVDIAVERIKNIRIKTKLPL